MQDFFFLSLMFEKFNLCMIDTGAYQESIAEPAGQAWSRAEDADHVTHQAAACRTSAMLAVQNINREARARRKRISQAQRQASEGIRQDSERERFLRALFAHNAARRQVRPPPGFEFSHPLASKAIPIMSDQEIEEICKNIRNFAITDSHDGECDGENCTCEGCIVARIAMAMSTTNE